MAGALDFDIEILGKGGHGALPHLASDALFCGATLLAKLQTIVSRNIDPFEPVVISVGKMRGGSARNVLPPSCQLCGTARALRTATLKHLRRRIKAMTHSLTRAFQCRARIEFGEGYPPLVNDHRANSYLRSAASKSLGAGAVVTIKNPLLGGEDFARYLEHTPGAMFHLGIRNRSIGATQGWHHPGFIADENAISVGVKTLVHAALCYLDD
jgi:amidohydrolase